MKTQGEKINQVIKRGERYEKNRFRRNIRFSKIRENEYYYIDKTGLICEVLKNPGTEVTLITRPRRFGKTLGMSMLAEFFNIEKDSRKIFQGLEISNHEKLCHAWQNQRPTVFLTFKNVDGLSF